MKPFDLEKAKAGAPLITRDERKAKFIGYVEECADSCKLIVYVEGRSTCLALYKNGRVCVSDGNTNHNDLFMAPNLVTKYANLSNSGWYTKHDTETDAISSAAKNPCSHLAIAVPVQVDIS